MSLPPPHEIKAQLQGSWSLPVTADASAVISFLGRSEFWWVLCANSLQEKVRQFFMGNQWHGDWSVITERRPNTVGEVAGRKFTKIRKTAKFRLGSAPPPPVVAVERGLFLRLNFMELPKSILNLPLPLPIHGIPVPINLPMGDILGRVLQTFQTGDYRILEFNNQRMTVEPCNGSRKQVWTRCGMSMG